jgi:hypothetical protein
LIREPVERKERREDLVVPETDPQNQRLSEIVSYLTSIILGSVG